MHDKPADRVSERALKLAGEVDADQPLFLWVHYADPHSPYSAPIGEGSPKAPACRALVAAVEAGALNRQRLFADRDGAASAALPDCEALYDAEIAFTDAAVGALLRGLEARGRSAVVVFSADHGENLGEEGLFYEHGPSLADASQRIPLIVAGPGVSAGRVDPWAATLEDVAPTSLALLGVSTEGEDRPALPDFDGVSLVDRLGTEPADASERIAFAESGSALQVSLYRYPVSGRADKKHCVNGARYALCSGPDASPTLFDHQADPDRRTPILDQPEATAHLQAAAALWAPEQARLRAARRGGLKAGGGSGAGRRLPAVALRCVHGPRPAHGSERRPAGRRRRAGGGAGHLDHLAVAPRRGAP